MKIQALRFGQSGASLIVSLIMLVVITLLALSAINNSTINLRIAGNMQARDEARSAAQQAIEQFASAATNFSAPPTLVTPVNIDIDKDGVNDYAVSIAPPKCRRAAVQQPPRSAQCASGVKSGLYCWDTLWDVEATATSSKTGVSQVVTQGVAFTFDPSFLPSSIGC